MRLVKTKDNSYTLYSDKYEECYHSISGALEESFKKFVEPCEIKEGMNLLDIGFGLGYNAGAAIQKARKINIIALEKDVNILKEIKKMKVPYWFTQTYEIIKVAAANLSCKDKNIELNIILGDATETIKRILTTKYKFDAVFLDPFSPPKNPELWTVEFFKDIEKRMNPNAKLATYSCAGSVRRNLKEAGFRVEDGPSIGRKAPSTIAIKSPS